MRKFEQTLFRSNRNPENQWFGGLRAAAKTGSPHGPEEEASIGLLDRASDADVPAPDLF